jgi:hypothetical protein
MALQYERAYPHTEDGDVAVKQSRESEGLVERFTRFKIFRRNEGPRRLWSAWNRHCHCPSSLVHQRAAGTSGCNPLQHSTSTVARLRADSRAKSYWAQCNIHKSKYPSMDRTITGTTQSATKTTTDFQPIRVRGFLRPPTRLLIVLYRNEVLPCANSRLFVELFRMTPAISMVRVSRSCLLGGRCRECRRGAGVSADAPWFRTISKGPRRSRGAVPVAARTRRPRRRRGFRIFRRTG